MNNNLLHRGNVPLVAGASKVLGALRQRLGMSVHFRPLGLARVRKECRLICRGIHLAIFADNEGFGLFVDAFQILFGHLSHRAGLSLALSLLSGPIVFYDLDL